MTRPTVVILCEHGEWEVCVSPQCPGGRVLNQAIIIERDTDGNPEWAIDVLWDALGPSFNRGQVNRILDALASAQDQR